MTIHSTTKTKSSKSKKSSTAVRGHAANPVTTEGETTMSKKVVHEEQATVPTPAVAQPVHPSIAASPATPGTAPPGTPTPASTPTEALIQQLSGQIDEIASSLGSGAVPLTIQQRRQLLKLRKGGDVHATAAVATATRYGLVIPGVIPTNVASDAALSQNLGALSTRIASLQGLVGDMSASAQSRLWNAGTTAYTMLTRLVPQYPSLQRELAPMASFLAVTYKDAPTSLRKQEKATNAKARATRKATAAKKDAADVAPPPAPDAAPAPTPTPAHAAPPAPAPAPPPATPPPATPTPSAS